MSWRFAAIALGIACAVLLWRDCTRAPARDALAGGQQAECRPARSPTSFSDDEHHAGTATRAEAEPPMIDFNGFQVPGWVAWFAPHPGEDLLAYRDRMVPIAQQAIAPQRARVARSRDDFAAAAKLDRQQLDILDGAAKDAASAIEGRVMNAILSGDFTPQQFKPMNAVSAARDVLDEVDGANKKFLASLREDQKAQLAQHPFDFADYLVFSTHWEDALGVASK